MGFQVSLLYYPLAFCMARVQNISLFLTPVSPIPISLASVSISHPPLHLPMADDTTYGHDMPAPHTRLRSAAAPSVPAHSS